VAAGFNKYLPHKDMPESYAHSVVHTEDYYININELLKAEAILPDVSKEDIEDVLAEIANDLKQGVFPLYGKKGLGGEIV